MISWPQNDRTSTRIATRQEYNYATSDRTAVVVLSFYKRTTTRLVMERLLSFCRFTCYVVLIVLFLVVLSTCRETQAHSQHLPKKPEIRNLNINARDQQQQRCSTQAHLHPRPKGGQTAVYHPSLSASVHVHVQIPKRLQSHQYQSITDTIAWRLFQSHGIICAL